MLENQENGINSSRATTKTNKMRCRSFHLRYLELCRSKNMAPMAEIRKNNKDQVTLDFFGDKVGVSEWLLITSALYCDQILQTVSIRLRKCVGPVLSQLDTERKAKTFKQKPTVFTKFVFSNLIESVSNCIENNKNLSVLILEGLPLNESYMECIAKAISTSTSIKEISFARSNIFDYGCGVICNTIKYLENIEKLNLSDTALTTKGAEHVADMIKMQKISRFTAGWQQSLRYRDFDANNIPGLRVILLARNPQIGDDGLCAILDILKDDIWVKNVDMENCGLTDRAANAILECINGGKFVVEFNLRGNPAISKFLLRNINEHMKKDEEGPRTSEDILRDFSEGRINGDELGKIPKLTIQQLITQLKATNEQLELERRIRKKAEELNEKLTAQIIAYENKLSTMGEDGVPDGFVVVNSENLQTIIRERNELQKIVGDEPESDYIESKENEMASPRAKKLSFKLHEEHEIQFKAPLPEPSISPSDSARSIGSLSKSARQQLGHIRKVKSEMQYVEQTKRVVSSKKREPKSDYDYGNESDIPRFERNIGDSAANAAGQKMHNYHHQQQHQQQSQQQMISRRSVQHTNNVQYIKKQHDMDDISLSSRSQISDAASADSETLRRNGDTTASTYKKVSKNSKRTLIEYGQGEGTAMMMGNGNGMVNNGNGKGASAKSKQRRSPRSLFLGLCDD